MSRSDFPSPAVIRHIDIMPIRDISKIKIRDAIEPIPITEPSRQMLELLDFLERVQRGLYP